MAHGNRGGAGTFVGGVGQNIVATVCGNAIGVGCVAIGLTKTADLQSFDNWRLWILIIGGVIVAGFGGNAFRLLAGWRTRRRIGRASGERIALLIARLDGDDAHAPKRREIEAAIKRELGNAVDVTSWPESLAIPDGRDIDASAAAQRTAQRWLARTRCDLLIWGHVKGDSAVELRFATRKAPGDSKSYGLTRDTMELPPDFGADLAAALAARVAVEAAPAFESGQFADDLLHKARARIAPLLERKLPDETRAAILFSNAAILAALGKHSSDPADLNEALAAYRAVLEVRTREASPLEWAVTQNNLGNALRLLGERQEGTAALDEAVAACRAALEVHLREVLPLDWAMTQNNLGTALGRLGERQEGTAALDDAVAAFRAALEVYTREALPLDWARAQNNLGIALTTLGGREKGTAALDEAVAAHRAALEVHTREALPLAWARTQNNLGFALTILGGRGEGTAALEAAVVAYRAALEVHTRETLPLDWATTQNNLGNALRMLGARTEGTAALDAAVAAYRTALEVRTREALPLDTAMTQASIGIALLARAAKTGQSEDAGSAVLHFELALEIFAHPSLSLYRARVESYLADARALVDQLCT